MLQSTIDGYTLANSGSVLAVGLTHDWTIDAPFGLRAPDRANGQINCSPNLPIIQHQAGYCITTNTTKIPIGDSSGSGNPGADIFTISWRIYLASGASGAFYGVDTGNFGICVRFSGTQKIQLLKQQTVQIGESTGSVRTGMFHHGAVTYNGTTATFYIDGVQSGTGTSAQTFTRNVQYYLNKGYSTECLTSGSLIKSLRTWRRVLSAPEVFLDSQFPDALYRPIPTIKRYFGAVAAAGGTTIPVFMHHYVQQQAA